MTDRIVPTHKNHDTLPPAPLSPNAVIGILGGGQLGRMLAMAAAQLGFQSHIYCPDKNNPAEQVTNRLTRKAYDDEAALATFASTVDVVTYEFENIPVQTVEILSQHVPVFPDARTLNIAQDRLHEKEFLKHIGIDTAPYHAAANLNDAAKAVTAIGLPAVLKTRRFGYDGKGQAVIHHAEELSQAWQGLASDKVIVEGFIPFEKEISILVARGRNGAVVSFPPAENIHKNHILDRSIVPARLDPAQVKEATAMAAQIVTALDYIGVLAVEFFVAASGLKVNEIAPRVHNSGHWSIEACPTSQFEQHIRAIAGLPLGDTRLYAPAEMQNLIGDDILDLTAYLKDPMANIHHYGKTTPRPGRKMGHITRLFPDSGNRT